MKRWWLTAGTTPAIASETVVTHCRHYPVISQWNSGDSLQALFWHLPMKQWWLTAGTTPAIASETVVTHCRHYPVISQWNSGDTLQVLSWQLAMKQWWFTPGTTLEFANETLVTHCRYYPGICQWNTGDSMQVPPWHLLIKLWSIMWRTILAFASQFPGEIWTCSLPNTQKGSTNSDVRRFFVTGRHTQWPVHSEPYVRCQKSTISLMPGDLQIKSLQCYFNSSPEGEHLTVKTDYSHDARQFIANQQARWRFKLVSWPLQQIWFSSLSL
jgi:putative component of membrane protein insertase Oxa1/YidC/SpoIIIJ protein YidD